MPMNGPDLATALKPVIEAQLTLLLDPEIVDPVRLAAFATAMANAIGLTTVTYIQANALVSGSVTSGLGAGGSITGTVT